MDRMNKTRFVWTLAWSVNVLSLCKTGPHLAVSRAGTRDVAYLEHHWGHIRKARPALNKDRIVW